MDSYAKMKQKRVLLYLLLYGEFYRKGIVTIYLGTIPSLISLSHCIVG